MKIFLSLVLIIFSLNSFSQIQDINNFDDLTKFQNGQKLESETVVVWGKFGSWGKFGWNSYKDICPSVLKQSDYSGLLSALDFKLFSDSTSTYYLPIKKNAKIYSDFKVGDIIKLKVRLYRKCKILNNKIYFLIEEILWLKYYFFLPLLACRKANMCGVPTRLFKTRSVGESNANKGQKDGTFAGHTFYSAQGGVLEIYLFILN